jgi:cell division protein FtsA
MEKTIVGFHFSTTQLTGIAGTKDASGRITVLSQHTVNASSFMSRGVVHNIDLCASAIKEIIGKISSRLNANITRAYVGFGAYSVHSKRKTIEHQLDRERLVNREDIDVINDLNRQTNYEEQEILEVIPQEYIVNGEPQVTPVGMMTEHIKAYLLNITGEKRLKKTIIESFAQLGVEVLDFFISPLLLAQITLSKEKLKAGCAIIDFGAHTTTVSVYKFGTLRHYATIPLGSYHITRDISTLGIIDAEAEEMKINQGNAINNTSTEDDKIIETKSGTSVKESLLHTIIEARVEEIVANAVHQIKQSGYFTPEQLISGIYLCGEGAKLRELGKVVANKSKIDKVFPLPSTLLPYDNRDTSEASANHEHYMAALALISQGNANCCTYFHKAQPGLFDEEFQKEEAKEQEEKPTTTKKKKEKKKKQKDPNAKPGFFKKIMRNVTRLTGEMMSEVEDSDESVSGSEKK